MGPSPSVIASSEGDRQPLLQALGALRPSDGPADLQDALQLAVAAAGARSSGTRLVVLSDGITEPLSEPVTLPFPYQYDRIGVSGENAGVTSLSVLPSVTGEAAVAHVQNFGQLADHLTAEMYADGTLLDARSVDLAPKSGEDLSFPVPPGSSSVRVELSPPDDFALDQVAVAVAAAPEKVKILLVSAGDVFLEEALALRPDAQVVAETPSQWRASQASSSNYGLFVFDGFVPPTLPTQAPYLVVGPPVDQALGTGPALSPGPLLPAEADDPLLYDVDLSDVSVAASADLRSSHFGNAVITSAAGPVLLVRPATSTAPAAALLGVYLHDSDFVLRSAFPILLEHLSEYLAPGTVPAPSQTPGSDITISPGAGATRVAVTPPNGQPEVIWRVSAPSASAGTVLFAGTSQPGLYRVEVTKRTGPPTTSYFAVDVPGTPIAPAKDLQVVGTPGKSLPTSSLYKAVWPWLALAGLVLLMVEWVVYHRAS
jgi:Ca-activated chloride channel family protein